MAAPAHAERGPFAVSLEARDTERDLQVAIDDVVAAPVILGSAAVIAPVVEDRRIDARRLVWISADEAQHGRYGGAVRDEAAGNGVPLAAESDMPIIGEPVVPAVTRHEEELRKLELKLSVAEHANASMICSSIASIPPAVSTDRQTVKKALMQTAAMMIQTAISILLSRDP